MSATDELRRLLDERGVEWLNSYGDCCDSDDDYTLAEQDSRKTTWSVDIAGDDMTITAHEVYENDELKPWFDLEFHEYFTPEQTIAATLGGGKITAEQVMAIAGRHQPDYCSDTHVCFDWQAIADELNATLGSGTCDAGIASTSSLECLNGVCHRSKFFPIYAEPDGFCAWGERRSE